MPFRHQNIRTSQKGRRPIESDLLDGQLAVNFNEETPGIFFKTDEGDVLKAGPTHIGTEPPILVKQANYGLGETWFDLNAGIIKIWDGNRWRDTSFPVDADLKGEQGVKGDTGDKGNRGYDGQDGKKGQKGDEGAKSQVPGPQGYKGEQGVKGEDGITGGTGPKGDDGGIGEKGGDGLKGDPGEKGEDGTSIKLLGSVADLAALNALPGPHESGDIYSVVDDGSGEANVAYVWTGSAWSSVGPITGPKGEKGIKGIDGIQGPEGPEGGPGEKGLQGDKGDDGAQGIQGEKLEFGDLTEADKLTLKGDKGEKGEKLEFSDLTVSEAESLKGDTGDSAYDSAKSEGFVGSEGEWVESLKGEKGASADVSTGFVKTTGDTMTGDLSVQGPDSLWAFPSKLSHLQLDAYQIKVGSYTPMQSNMVQLGMYEWRLSQSMGMEVKISPYFAPNNSISTWTVQPLNGSDTSTEIHRIEATGMGFFRGGLRTGGNMGSTATFQAGDDGQVNMRHFLNIERAGGAGNVLQFKAEQGLYLGDSWITGQPDLQIENNIALNLDGSAKFADKVTSASTIDTDAGITLTTKDYVDAQASGGVAPGTYVQIAGDNMTGDLTLGTDLLVLSASSGSATLSGACNVSRDAGNKNVFVGGTNIGGVQTNGAVIKADGSAQFAGVCTVGDRVVCNKDGENSNTQNSFISYQEDGATAGVSFTAGGSATFKGDVIVGNSANNGANDGIYLYNQGQILASRSLGSNSIFSGYTTGDSTVTCDIKADGSAIFSSVVKAVTAAGASGGYRHSQTDGGYYLQDDAGNSSIALYKDGSATLSGNLTINNSSGDAQAYLQNDGSLNVAWGELSSGLATYVSGPTGRHYIGFNETTNTGMIMLSPSDGSGTFAGQITAGDGSASPGTSGVGIGAPGYVSISQSDRTSQNCLSIYDTTNAISTFSVTGEGSAEFASYVSSDTFFWSKNTDSVNAGLYLYNYDGNPNRADAAFAVSPTNGSTAHTATIDYDGKATFAGGVQTGTSSGYAYSLGTPAAGAGGLYLETDTSGILYLAPSLGGSSTISLYGANGSATFAGGVSIYSPSAGSSGIQAFGVYGANVNTASIFTDGSASFKSRISITSPSAANAFLIRDTGGNDAIAMYGNGSASFAGNITAPNVTFALELDDDTKYTTTTDSEGVETCVYNGAVLDVKDRLEKADTALQTLKTAAAAAGNFAALKAAIATALADI